MRLFILNLLGMGLGTLGMDWLSKVYGALGDVSISYALLSSLLFCAAGVLGFARASEPYARTVQPTRSI